MIDTFMVCGVLLETLQAPFLCDFSAKHHVTGGDSTYLTQRTPGAQGQPHTAVANAAHLRKDNAVEFTSAIVNFIRSTR
ncbi:hypothetical protein AB0M28_20840 [Streptomyces sp. NPDC051940]|uniref:hypothetical protein n=1 Tax=Streptomyces sp. NPDC051940 TaxID=3155675 RepID=UPI00341C8D31